MAEPRVISLIASATEIMCALGAEKWLVGISHECDYPEHILNRPRCSASAISSALDSGEIDRRVREMTVSGRSWYVVDAKRVLSLKPSAILTQVQCEVCAVSPKDLEGIGLEELDPIPQIIPLNTSELADLYVDILRVARAIRLEGRAFELCQSLKDRLEVLRTRTKNFPKRKVACLEWLNPLMIAGNWMPELVGIAGGKAILTNAWGKSQQIDFEQLRDADPDVIVFMPCGFSLDRTIDDVHTLFKDERMSELKAVQTGMAYAVDGNAYFNRPGPRLIESAELLAQLLHPSVFDFPGFERSYFSIDFRFNSTP